MNRKKIVNVLFKKSKKWSIFFAYTIKKYIVWTIHHDSITQKLFDAFVYEQILFLCTFATFEKFNSIIICDNVFVHKFDRFKKMCETIDVKLTFLFFYSSNFNSIKTFFVVFKRWIKRNDHIVESYELHFENFERFFANAMFAQNQRNDFNKLFRTTKYDYF